MNIYQKIKRWILKRISKDPKLVFPDHQYPIEWAFNFGGVDYYKFASEFNIPYERGLKTVVFYEEARMKMDLEYVKKHTQAIDEILMATKINIFEIKALNDQMKERINMPFDVALLYKLASIVYFDRHENPKTYDYRYNSKKIARWKEGDLANSFFFQAPLLDLMPFLRDAEKNFQEYSEINRLVNKLHSEKLSSHMATQ